MKLDLWVILVLTASFTNMALVSGIVISSFRCNSDCAACWKDGEPGVDTKMSCHKNVCSKDCPAGYNTKHCAKIKRCLYVDPFSLHKYIRIPCAFASCLCILLYMFVFSDSNKALPVVDVVLASAVARTSARVSA